jgi:hypothetical protein
MINITANLCAQEQTKVTKTHTSIKVVEYLGSWITGVRDKCNNGWTSYLRTQNTNRRDIEKLTWGETAMKRTIHVSKYH